MPLAVAQPLRIELVRRRLGGERLTVIAAELGLPCRTARGLWCRFRRRGAPGLEPDYDRCGRRGPRFAAAVHAAALALKREHAGWGARLLRLELAERFPAGPLPSARTVNRWLRSAGLRPLRARRPRPAHRGRGRTPHAVWQIDAKEQVRLGDGQHTGFLTVADEASGAAVGAVPFPPPLLGHRAAAGGPGGLAGAVRALGAAERVRADNGWPWGAAGDLPPALALWLLGLGVGVVWNRPRRPQENGIVERFHGLVAPWAEPATCANFAAWRRRLAWLVELQRDRYPVDGTRSRREAWPGLTVVARPYGPAREAEHWDLGRVTAYLAQGLWPRQVDKVGRVSLYHRPYSVGRRHAGRRVFVGFDPDARAWVVRDQTGRELRRHPAAQITAERICHLELSHLRPAQRHRGATQLHGTSEP